MELLGGTNTASAKSGVSPIEMEVRGVRCCRSEAAMSVAESTGVPAYETEAGVAGGGMTPTRL